MGLQVVQRNGRASPDLPTFSHTGSGSRIDLEKVMSLSRRMASAPTSLREPGPSYRWRQDVYRSPVVAMLNLEGMAVRGSLIVFGSSLR
jgi:hypothetical protein